MTMKMALCAGFLTLFQSVVTQAQDTLGLEEAIELAIRANDPAVQSALSRHAAEQSAAIAAGALPDPMASVSVRNLPVDSFDLTQEAMTQLHLGVRQQFPRGDSRKLMREGRLIKADEHAAAAKTSQRGIIRDVSTAWYQAQYSSVAASELDKLLHLLTELRKVQEGSFAAADEAAIQKVYRTELEVALVEDRLISISQIRDGAIETLARYIGRPDATRPLSNLPASMPRLSQGEIDSRLEQHPMVLAADARNRGALNKVSLAKEAYKPQWGLEVGYGARYGDRSDFASAMVTFDLPIWTSKRQDPALQAAKQNAQSAELGRDALLLDLKRQARIHMADITNLERRVENFNTTILPQAESVVVATRNAYGAGGIDFSELIRAEIALVDSQLRLAMLRRDLGIAHTRLAFLTGDPS